MIHAAQTDSPSQFLRQTLVQLRSNVIVDNLWPALNGALRLVGGIVAGMDPRGDRAVCDSLLEEILLPLHRPNGMVLWRDQTPVLGMFHEALVFALVKVVEVFYESEADRDGSRESVLMVILRGLFSQWPRGFGTNTPKEVLLLHETDMLLRYCSSVDFDQLLPELADLLAHSFSHDNAVPMQRALEFFKNDVFLRLISGLSRNRTELLVSALVPSLYRGGRLHWNPTVNKMTALVLSKLRSTAPAAFDSFALKSISLSEETERLQKTPFPRPITNFTATGGSAASRGRPPTTLAPWAQQSMTNPAAKRRALPLSDGLVVLLDYIDRCKGRDEEREAQEEVAEQGPLKLKFHDMVFGRELGSGAFSVVRFAKRIIRDRPQSRWPEYAVKIVSSSSATDSGMEPGEVLFAALKEISILKMMVHPGIARLVSSFRYRSSIYLVLELGGKGDLHTHVIRNGGFSEDLTRFIVGEVTAALLAVHDKGLVFNDLKPENVLLCTSNHVKLTDFGACRPVTADGKSEYLRCRISYTELVNGDWRDEAVIEEKPILADEFERGVVSALDLIEGTPAYQPRELLMCKINRAHFPRDMNPFLVDAWALGCLMSFCLNGKPLYFGAAEDVLSQMEAITSPQTRAVRFDSQKDASCLSFYHDTRHGVSVQALQLLDSLLAISLQDRIFVSAAVESVFLSDGGRINPLQLHMHDAPEIPNKLEAEAVDQAWARRQLSVVWAPMPATYSFVGRNDFSLPTHARAIQIDAPIPETYSEMTVKF